MPANRNAALEWIAAPVALLMLLVVLYRLLEPLAPKAPQEPVVQAARDSTTAVNIWAPHGSDCKLPSDWRLTAKANGHGRTAVQAIAITIASSVYPHCIGVPAEAIRVDYIPAPGFKGRERVTVEQHEGDKVTIRYDYLMLVN
jgi:hypothetical protein